MQFSQNILLLLWGPFQFDWSIRCILVTCKAYYKVSSKQDLEIWFLPNKPCHLFSDTSQQLLLVVNVIKEYYLRQWLDRFPSVYVELHSISYKFVTSEDIHVYMSTKHLSSLPHNLLENSICCIIVFNYILLKNYGCFSRIKWFNILK